MSLEGLVVLCALDSRSLCSYILVPYLAIPSHTGLYNIAGSECTMVSSLYLVDVCQSNMVSHLKSSQSDLPIFL